MLATKKNTMKKIVASLLLLAGSYGYGQELNLPTFTQYLADNPFVISPAYAGIGDNLRIRVNGLAQWVGVKDAPQNQALYADFRVLDQSGVGVFFYNDKNGYTRQTGAKVSFAHHLILDYYSKQYLSLGISYNFNNFKVDINEFQPPYGNVGVDPYITDNRYTANNNFDVTALYRNKGFFAAFTASNILKKNLNKFDINEPNLLNNYQLYTGLVIKGANYSEIEPSAYIQYFASDGRSSTDLNIKYRKYNRYDDYYWVGASYRFLNDQPGKPLNIGPMAGLSVSKFYFGYSYQITANDMAAFNSGTHMVTLGFDFLQSISNCPCTQGPVHD